ncbi:MAG: hypothetical protein K6A38_05440 [Lachnospiraceae bacterium]|nr:hypothetical protein [Lachnospiraceae bacterium]
MKKVRSLTVGSLVLACAFVLSACGPSEDKIIQAQAAYRNLINTHNAVVAAHNEIKDNSLDEELTALAGSIPEIESFNLYEMTDAQIDSLIGTMNTMTDSYAGYLKTIGEIKLVEDAKELTPVVLTIKNDTDITFSTLYLYEKDSDPEPLNALESLSGLAPGREIVGLTIYKNAANTPWILSLDDKEILQSEASEDDPEETDDEEGSSEEDPAESEQETGNGNMIELDVSRYNTETMMLTIKKNEETGEFFIE